MDRPINTVRDASQVPVEETHPESQTVDVDMLPNTQGSTAVVDTSLASDSLHGGSSQDPSRLGSGIDSGERHFQSKAEAVRSAMKLLPRNSFGLPEGIYRSDLIPTTFGEHHLEAAFVPLTYAEGFPTLPNGLPVWAELEFEPQDAYFTFERYLRQPLGGNGARQLFVLHQEITQEATKSITAAEILKDGAPNLAQLQEFFDLYHWGVRAKAFDLFETAVIRRERMRRALTTEDRHFVVAQRLLDTVMGKMGIDPNTLQMDLLSEQAIEFWSDVTPKVAIDLLDRLTKLQRVSVGLPAGGPANQGGGSSNTPDANSSMDLEVILRGIASGSAPVLDDRQQGVNKADLVELLADPKSASLAQELVLRVHTNPNKRAPDEFIEHE